jgi:hypothetical protein
MHETEFVSTKVIHRKGSVGYGTEWWTPEDWQRHRRYCEELESKGELGKEVEYTFHMKPLQLFDNPITSTEYKDIGILIPL